MKRFFFSFFKEGDAYARQFFYSLEMREAATAPGIFRKRNQMMLFEIIFSRLHVLFCLVFSSFFGGGGVPLKPRNGGFGISLFREIMPDQEGPTISPFLRKTFYENEEFMFSKLSKMKIFRGFFFISNFEDSMYKFGTENNSVLKIIKF